MRVDVLVDHAVKVSPCGSFCKSECRGWTVHNDRAVCLLFLTGAGSPRVLTHDGHGSSIRAPQCIDAENRARGAS